MLYIIEKRFISQKCSIAEFRAEYIYTKRIKKKNYNTNMAARLYGILQYILKYEIYLYDSWDVHLYSAEKGKKFRC